MNANQALDAYVENELRLMEGRTPKTAEFLMRAAWSAGYVAAIRSAPEGRKPKKRASPSVPQAVPQAALDAAVAAERERCARLCETADGFRDQREHGGKLAALIRKA